MPLQQSLLLDRLRAATIGRYDIYAELGSGGMATVFLALDLALDRKVAIKVLNPALAADQENVERFKREAKVAAALNHPHIIGIYAVGDDPELAYFVMKFVEGRALDSVVREEGALDVPFVKSVINTAGKALHYAHTRGVVHRDVKPANLMLDEDGWLIVTDFGIAKMEDAKGLTVTGSVLGTPYYMAPEQFQGKGITPAADQYALGVVAFELLTGRQPYDGDTLAEVMRGHLFDPIPSVRELRPDIPEDLDATVTRMLAKEPEQRFATLEDAVRAFGMATETQELAVRTQIINLAKSGAHLRPQIAVPPSPAPSRREKPGGSGEAPPTVRTAAANVPATRSVRTARLPDAEEPPRRVAARGRSSLGWVLLALMLGVGGTAVVLRPDLLDRVRKLAAFRGGDLRETGIVAPPPVNDAAMRDSLAAAALAAEQKGADAIRDSVARADSIERADSLARVAEAARRAAARREEQRRAAATPPAPDTERATTSPGGPPAIRRPSERTQAEAGGGIGGRESLREQLAERFGLLSIYTRVPNATLFVGNQRFPMTSNQMMRQPLPVGRVEISIRSALCEPWDTIIVVEPGQRYNIGLRPTRCR